MTTEETLRDIKKELRANMNGVASAYMREHGLKYHVIFGIELPRLKAIASEFQPNHQVAQQLWHEDVRESKILATMLMPVDNFDQEICDIWAEQIPNTEIAQMAVLHLFTRLPYASEKAFEWMASANELLQLCGYLLITRLVIEGGELSPRAKEEFVDQAHAALGTENPTLRKAIQNALSRIQDSNE